MTIFLESIQLFLGFFLLIKGADWLIDHSVLLSKKFKLNPLLVGVLVVSIGTSIPELIVTLLASFQENASSLIMGNIVGSNIANVFLVLGVLATFNKIPINKNITGIYLFNFFVIVLLIAFSNFSKITSDNFLTISSLNGLVFLGLFLVFIFFSLKNKTIPLDNIEEIPSNFSLKKSLFFIALAIAMLSWGGDKVVNGALFLAREVFNISEGFIGLTIVAIGTSLPEVITSLLAGRKKQMDLALGNILGSNLFNILWVLGVASLVNPLVFESYFNLDMTISLFSLIMLGLITFLSFKGDKTKQETNIGFKSGMLFLIAYCAYLFYLFYRG